MPSLLWAAETGTRFDCWTKLLRVDPLHGAWQDDGRMGKLLRTRRFYLLAIVLLGAFGLSFLVWWDGPDRSRVTQENYKRILNLPSSRKFGPARAEVEAILGPPHRQVRRVPPYKPRVTRDGSVTTLIWKGERRPGAMAYHITLDLDDGGNFCGGGYGADLPSGLECLQDRLLYYLGFAPRPVYWP